MENSLDEMCRLVTGRGMWHIGDIQVSDGPHGIRAQEDGAKNNDSYEATCFPTAAGVACSWNRNLVEEMARALAMEAKALGVSVVLGPGVNIKRSPLCGRNFEYYTEDPYLAGELATSYILAMQECGVGTSLKHFACNNQETHRMTSNSMVDEKALHEIYLRAFEKAVKCAKPATVMASYNYLNGTPVCENKHLLTDILRREWKYEGLVMSDWGACVDLPACILAGMDVEMPDSCGNHASEIKNAAVSEEEVRKRLQEATRRIEKLQSMYPKTTGECQNELKENKFEKIGKGVQCKREIKETKGVSNELREKNHALAERIAEESVVLLKNDDFFPLKGTREILLVGDLADAPRIQGGGSSHVHTEKTDTFLEQFEKYGVKVRFARGYKKTSFQRSARLEKEAVAQVKKAAADGVPILFFGGLTELAEGEGYDRESFDMPDNQRRLLEQLLECKAQMGFVSFGGAPYDMEFPSRCRALLHLYLGGEAMAEACVRILLGLANPSGKLAESIPYHETDVPSFGFFGRQGEQKNHLDDVEYRESIFVGYRYYETFGVPVRYCLGYGLSYTSFDYSDLRIEETSEGTIRVSFFLENTGDVAGSEISEVYVKNPSSRDFRPIKELRGFAKTTLLPGEKKKVLLELDDRAFFVYQNHQFQKIAGKYEILVGSSLQDIRLSKEIEVKGETFDFPLQKNVGVPLSEENFQKIYSYPSSLFSKTKPGEFTVKNSLVQMQPFSRLAGKWMLVGKLLARLLYFPKSHKDPEVRMMTEGILEGNLDSVCNQSGGLIKKKTIENIVASANKGGKR